VAAIPLRGSASAYISAGTWSLVGVEVREPLITDAAFAANLTNEGGVGGTFRLLRNVTGLWLVHECRRAWALEGHEYSFDQLVALAKEAPPLRSFVEPNDPAFADPGDMPARVRAFCAHTGQPEPVGPGAVVRCILESLALKHVQTVELLAAVTGTAPDVIHVVGGGARNELLCRWTADAAGLPVVCGPEEATLLGNLLVQAIALDEIGSLADAREIVAASFATTMYEPQVTAAWQEARVRFAEAVSLPNLEVPA
jgi:rhamnulokinase